MKKRKKEDPVKKAEANRRYKATPEGRAIYRRTIQRYNHRKRIEQLEHLISEEGIKEYKQSIRDKITEVKKKLESIPYANDKDVTA
tara:strand:- start:362 stop:619 length:258 start_codon:yes stop_codon:yes gene_type:complete